MNKEKLLNGIDVLRQRLLTDVVSAYQQRGSSFGSERFDAWKKVSIKFID